MKLNHHRTCS